MEKPKMSINRLTTLYEPNAQRIIMANETFLKWEYYLLSLTLMMENVVY